MLTEILQLVHEISSLKDVFYKKVFCKTSQTSQVNTGSSHLEVFLGVKEVFCQNTFCRMSFLIKLQAENLKFY